MYKKFSAVLLCLASTVSVGLGQNYFPLRQGSTWEYSLDVTKETARTTLTITEKILPSMSIKGKKVIPMQSNNGYLSFYDINSNAVLWVGKQKPSDLEPTIFDASIIELPLKPVLGYAWEVPIESALQNGKTVLCGISIDRLDETVVLPSGVFEHCVRLKVAAKEPLTSIERYLWYAPDVGLIKEIYTEVYENGYRFDWITFNYTMQLVNFKK